MSHELRTPLNAIIGFSEILETEAFGLLNDKQKEYLKFLSDSGKHLLELINDILDIAKVESGKLELFLKKFNLKELLENSIVMIKEKAFVHNIEIIFNINKNIDFIVADQRKIKQIVFNLLSNAVKFTPDGEKIGIDAERKFDGYYISIWDTGRGIDSIDMAKIFEEFEQGKNVEGQELGGTGLGLSLSKKLVELHGGKIEVFSEGKDKGTRFTFIIPTDLEEKID